MAAEFADDTDDTDDTASTDGRIGSDPVNCVYFATVRARVPVERLLDDERLCALAAEDAIWAIWLSDWQRRRPSWMRRPAQRRWIGEGERLYLRRRQLAADSAALGVGTRPGG